jgi:hypothetical protein
MKPQEAIAGLEYGRFNLLEEKPRIEYDTRQAVKISPFLHLDTSRTYGDCLELSLIALTRLAPSNKTVYIATGAERRYNANGTEQHTFLLQLERPVKPGNITMRTLAESGALVIDAAYKTVTPLLNSGYTISHMHAAGTQPTGRNVVLCQNSSPIGRTHDDEIICVYPEFGFGAPHLRVAAIAPGKPMVMLPSNSRPLREKLRQDARLEGILDVLCSAPMTFVKRNLFKDRDITF